MKRRWAGGLALLLALGAGSTGRAVAQAAASQAPSAGPAPAVRSVWDSVYSAPQATRGDSLFRRACASCHTGSQFSGTEFFAAWNGASAWQLFALLRTQMPLDAPGSLSDQQYLDLVAYLFSLNRLPPGSGELVADSASLRRIRIEARPGGTSRVNR